MTMKNEPQALTTLGEMIWDCLNDENITHQELVRTIRSSLGESAAWHKQSADKAQNALDEMNKLPEPVISNQAKANELYWLRPGGAASRDILAEGPGGAYNNYADTVTADTICFTGATKDDTISLG